ncbi:MAG TPA: hypothetical protein DCE71_06285 [Parachlamydiales bacterium]|nr:hypothetical protein [Parachlamydiales bacterium]
MKSITLILCLLGCLFCRDTEAFSSARHRHTEERTKTASHSSKKKRSSKARRSKNTSSVSVGMHFHSGQMGPRVGWAPQRVVFVPARAFYYYQPEPILYVGVAKRHNHHANHVFRKKPHARPFFVERGFMMPMFFTNVYPVQNSISLNFNFI